MWDIVGLCQGGPLVFEPANPKPYSLCRNLFTSMVESKEVSGFKIAVI